MKKILFSITTIALISMLMFACRKDDKLDSINPDDLFDNLVAARKSPVQLFEIDNQTGGTITGVGGARITFPPCSFTGGCGIKNFIIIKLRESLSKSQWMMDRLSTTAQNDILISGGMLNVEAVRKETGADIDLSPAMKIPNANLNAVVKAEVPRNVAVNIDMNLFVPDSLPQGGPVIAPNAPVLSWKSATNFPFGNGPNSYIFQLPKLSWSNCDRFYGQPGSKTTIRVTPNMSGYPGATNVQVMLVFRNISSVITLPSIAAYFESYSNSMPVGSQADVVLIGKNANGKILFKVLPATTFTALLNVAITPEEVPGATVTTYLNSIN